MFISWWLIIPLVTGICLLFKTVSRLANEIDKLETALEESNGKSRFLAQRAEVLKQANQYMNEGFIQAKCYTQRLQNSSGPEQESLLNEMNNILTVVTGNEVTDLNFIEHRSIPDSPLNQNFNVPESLFVFKNNK